MYDHEDDYVDAQRTGDMFPYEDADFEVEPQSEEDEDDYRDRMELGGTLDDWDDRFADSDALASAGRGMDEDYDHGWDMDDGRWDD